MIRFLLFLALVVGLNADVTFVTGVSLSNTTRNDASAKVGCQLKNGCGVDITITQVGRWKVSGNSQTHTVGIYTGSVGGTATAVATASVDMSTGSAGTFVYATLSSPYTWTAGSTIYLYSTETNGGDSWYEHDTTLTYTNVATILSSSVADPLISALGDQNRSYVPVSFKYSGPVASFSQTSATTWDCAADQYSINVCMGSVSTGDTVNLPVADSATWGAAQSFVLLSKAITLNGHGTTVNIAPNAPTYSSAGVLVNTGGARVTGLTFQQPLVGGTTTAIKVATTAGWRIDHCTYESATSGDPGYFIYAIAYGLIDHNTINTYVGNDEWLLARGPSDSWTTANSLGTANAIFVEDNTFNGPSYMDFNSNARGVVRFNVFHETAKNVDGHGYWTNSPPYGVRQTEVYYNSFLGTSGNYSAIEIRGGLHYGFFNTTLNNSAGYTYSDYGYQANNGNWGFFQTPSDYPLFFQAGTGTMTTINATALVANQRCEIKTTGSTTLAQWQAIGAPNNNIGTQFTATGAGVGSGTVLIAPATEPGYIFGNTQNGSVWAVGTGPIGTNSTWLTNTAGYAIGATSITIASRTDGGSQDGRIGAGDAVSFSGDTNGRYLVTSGFGQGTQSGVITIASPGLLQAIPASAVTMTSGPLATYQQKSGNPSATFTSANIILSNRNYFADAGAAPNTGAYVGTAATMAGLTAVGKTNQAFWVTNEGSWRAGFTNTSGRMYISNGATWVLSYTPYTYPHPLQGAAPYLVGATINTSGTTLTLVWSESCTTGAGGSGGVTVTPSGGASTATYSSGSGSNTYVYSLSRSIGGVETLTTSYTQPGNGIEATTGGADVASYSGSAVTNNSTANAIINATTINATTIRVGP